jgi:hypothetical protein
VPVSWAFGDSNGLSFVYDKVNENNESLTQWRKRSKTSSVTRLRVVSLVKSDYILPTYFPQMLEVAKTIQYFHSLDIVLHDHVGSVCICHF